jgi:branched-chain amino acid transport system substrate-binding protein
MHLVKTILLPLQNEGVKLAVEEINKDGGIDGKKIEYVSKDNKSDNNEAASVAVLFLFEQ